MSNMFLGDGDAAGLGPHFETYWLGGGEAPKKIVP